MTTALEAAAPAANHSAPNTAASPTGTQLVPLSDIRVDPRNRKNHDPAKLKELAAQIEAEGLLQPIVLRRLRDDERAYVARSPHPQVRYQIIAGERRYHAHHLLKRLEIEAKIVEKQTELQAVTKQVVENMGREQLNPMDLARQMKRLQVLELPQAEIGKLFGGLSQPAVSNTIKLLQLPPAVQEMVAAGELSPAHGAELVRYAAWPKACHLIAKKVIDYGWDARELRGDIPCSSDLAKAGLAVLIYTGDFSYEARPKYKMPVDLAKEPGFFHASYWEWCYLLPEDPKAANLWEPEREKQDEARAAAAAAEKKSAETAKKKGGKPTKEQKERQEKLAKNKAARAAIDGTLAHAVLELRDAKGVHVDALSVICDEVLGHADYGGEQEIKQAAAAIGLKLPKSIEEDCVGGGEANAELRKMGPEAMVKLAAAVIMFRESREALRYAGAVPESAQFIAGKAARSAVSNSVKVVVKWKGGDYKAKAGNAEASSTSGEDHAAKAAAAKHFSTFSQFIDLLLVEKGSTSGEPWIYTATKCQQADGKKGGKAK